MAVDVVGAMSTMALLTSHVVEKIPFPSRRAHRLPPPPFNPNNTPHEETGGAIFVQQQLGASRAYTSPRARPFP
jgi:hypothetical protein